MKLSVSLLVITIALFPNFPTGFGFECWSNDENGPKVPGFFKYKLEDCDENLDILYGNPESNRRIVHKRDFEFACYKLVVDTGKLPIEMKGCVPKNGCTDLKTNFEAHAATAGPDAVPVKSVTCYECGQSGCNSGEKPKVLASVAVLLVTIARLV
nr:PREDICTED: uncharacterized protein LOC103313865 [Tribolium castaneum]|eukprot:XP_008196464.1 PREDICTED: uncharacterized protein LOC103313865 [Tribolium castaneum]